MEETKTQDRIEEIAIAVFSKKISIQQLRLEMDSLSAPQKSLLLERLARGARSFATTRY